MENCKKHSPVKPRPSQSDLMTELAKDIIKFSQMQAAEERQLLSTVKRASEETTKKPEKRKRAEKDFPEEKLDGESQSPNSSGTQSTRVSTESPKKRQKTMHVIPNTCSSKGCEKKCFWSKKWGFCPKCKKHFCPQHMDELHHHYC